ncbi:MAG TPA: isoprenylcysteine carboxylmethyltransferase family protein [Bdellovibrionota bacterium]|nr:isoprenylcysteine carboxylmethyltransferase family protein [Bdellovibrionota bacterium]
MAFSQPGTLVVVFLDYFFFHTTLEIPAFLKGIGLGLSILGFCIRLLAMRTLGQQYTMFVTIREGHRLVAHGIYKYVRHPGYLGQFVFLLGFVMLMGSVWGFLMYLFWVATQIYRMYVEERVLVEHLGDQYKNYQKKTKRLIPWIF